EVRIAPDAIPTLRTLVDQRSLATTDWDGSADDGGWRRLALTFERVEEARTALLGLRDQVEVLRPVSLRSSMAATARGLASIYGSP
ncbi:MAG: WYL domain-containing protein, partial [Candidatus Dormibacteraceae bacterium]